MFAQYIVLFTTVHSISAQCCKSPNSMISNNLIIKNLQQTSALILAKIEDMYDKMNLLDERFYDLQAAATSKNCNCSSSSEIPTAPYVQSCDDAFRKNDKSGIYGLEIPNSGLDPFYIYCLKNVENDEAKRYIHGSWLVIQRRVDGKTPFFNSWVQYKSGFGNLDGEFWIGLDRLHALTQSTLHELWIQLEDFEMNKRWAYYNTFAIGGEADAYALNILGDFKGDAGDSLISGHAGRKWSTWDRDNDDSRKTNCADLSKGAWWYHNCQKSNLNGEYGNNDHGKGINWDSFRGLSYSLKSVHMAIRPKP